MRELGQRWAGFGLCTDDHQETQNLTDRLASSLARSLACCEQTRNSLFGTLTWDTSSFTYLKIRCKPSPDEGMRYFVNIQTDGPGKLASSLTCILALSKGQEVTPG